MIPIGTHGLSCPEGEDYAAVALNMQANASALNSALAAQAAQLDTYNNRPWFIWTSTAVVPVASNVNVLDFDTPTAGLFNGSTVLSTTTTLGAPTVSSFGVDPVTGFLKVGWWLAGGYASYVASGAVTANSRRILGIQLASFQNNHFVYSSAVEASYESNTGGDAMTVMKKYYVNSSTIATRAALLFKHSNTGSNMNISVGAKLWMVYLGSGLNV